MLEALQIALAFAGCLAAMRVFVYFRERREARASLARLDAMLAANEQEMRLLDMGLHPLQLELANRTMLIPSD